MEEDDWEAVAGSLLTRRQMLTVSGVALSTLILSGCGGSSNDGGSQSVERLSVNPKRNAVTNDRGVETAFLGVVSTTTGALIAFWGTQDADGVPLRLTQALFWDAVPANGVRVLFDGQGLPTRIEHEENGAFVLIFWESDKATFKFYQPTGAYIGGSVVTRSNDQFTVVQLTDSQLVGYYSGRINGLTDGIITFTVGGSTTATVTNASVQRAQRMASSRSLSAEEFDQSRKVVAALAARSANVQNGFAGDLLKAVAQPLINGSSSELGNRIISAALTGTGLAPVFLREGRPILDGITIPFLLGAVTGRVQDALAKNSAAAPSSLAVAYISPSPVEYRAGNAFKTTQPVGDNTGIRGIAASRETGNVPVVGYIDSSNRVHLSGTAANGDFIELTGLVENNAISDGSWSLKTSPGSTRDQNGNWNGNNTPLGQCQEQQNSGGQGLYSNTYDLGKCGTFPFRYEAYTIPDQFQIYQDDNLLFDTGGPVSGGTTVDITAVGQTTLIRIVVTADLSGTLWNYTVGCPA